MTALTDHFSLEEFEQGGDAVPTAYLGNVQQLAGLLESVRSAGGGLPLRVTSGYRSAADNAAVGGVTNSDHETARAADVAPIIGPDIASYAATVLGSLNPATFGQFIVYPNDGHLHISLPGQHVGQVLVSYNGSYTTWDGVLDDLPPPGGGSVDAGTVDAPTGEVPPTVPTLSPGVVLLLVILLAWYLARAV